MNFGSTIELTRSLSDDLYLVHRQSHILVHDENIFIEHSISL